jgi:trigger factor
LPTCQKKQTFAAHCTARRLCVQTPTLFSQTDLKTHFETLENNKGLLTVTVEPEDYYENVRKSILQYARTAVLPGFRPGKVPVQLVKNRFGEALVLEQFNKIVPERIAKFLEEENIKYFSRPLQLTQDLRFDTDQAQDYNLQYELALFPDIDIDLSSVPPLKRYKLTVTEKDLNDEIQNYLFKAGEKVDAERADDADSDYYFEFLLSSENRHEPDAENLPELYRYLSVNTYFNPALKVKLQGSAMGEVVEANLSDVFPDGADFGSSVLNVSDEIYASYAEKPLYLRIEKLQRVVKAELTPERMQEIVRSQEPVTEEEFREKLQKQMVESLDNMAEYHLFKKLQSELLERYEDLPIAYDVIEKIFYQDQQKEGMKDPQAFFQQMQQLRESVRYHMITEKLKELFPAARLDYKEFHEDVKASIRKDFQLPEPEAHDHDHHEHDHEHDHDHDHEHHDHNHDHEGHTHSHQPDMADQILMNVAKQNPQLLEKQYQEHSSKRFYHTLLESAVTVEETPVSVKEFNKQMQIQVKELSRLPL